jgi:hypothetical protein
VRCAQLTAEGAALLRRTPGSSELGGRIMTRGLNEAERRELIRLLRKCTDNLTEQD